MKYYDEIKCEYCEKPANELNFGESFRYFNSDGKETYEYASPVCPDCVQFVENKKW